jgi:predicted amidophosphoribosyltransferase
MSSSMSVTALWADARQLLFPAYCVWCQDPGSWSCVACQERLRAMGPVVGACGELTVAAAAPYRDMAPAVLGYKERGITALADFLVERLVAAVAHHNLTAAVLVPIPTSARARRRRGADLITELTVAVATQIGWQWEAALVWRGSRKLQKRLTEAQRYQNMTNAFAVRPDACLTQTPVMLIDDVLTTGATLVAAAAALRSVQAGIVAGAVLGTSSQLVSLPAR